MTRELLPELAASLFSSLSQIFTGREPDGHSLLLAVDVLPNGYHMKVRVKSASRTIDCTK